jgi:putative transposase
MSQPRNLQDRDRWARLRFSIVGPLLAAPPAPGELHAALIALSAKTWCHPTTGAPVRFGLSTIERWLYAARRAQHDPLAALKTRIRQDAGQQRGLSRVLVEAIALQYREHPGWSCQLHYDNLRAALAPDELPSYSTVRRYMLAQGLFKKPRLRNHATAGQLMAERHLQQREVRSFEVDHVNGLWHLDYHEGSRKVLTRAGQWVTPIALAILDDRSRLACHLQWYLDQTAQSLVHGVCQALQRRGLPRSIMSDNGAAMIAEEFGCGLHHLGILHQTTLPYSPYQNGKLEILWGPIEGRLIPMLEGVEQLTLDLLNTATQAWAEGDYQRTVHSEIGTTPLARYLEGPDVGRECPGSQDLRRAFRIEVSRAQRRTDGTISLDGQRFEIPSRYRSLQRVHLRYARWDLSHIDLVDARSGSPLCALYPLDKSANAQGLRRVRETLNVPDTPKASGVAPLLRQLMADYAATGLPPAYLPTEPDPTP